MSAFIPQLDPDPTARDRQLRDARRHYHFNYTHVSPLAIIERIPAHHEFSHEWLRAVGHRLLTVLANRLEIEGATHFADYLRAKHGLIGRALEMGSLVFVTILRDLVHEALRFTGRASAEPVRASDLEEYGKLFRGIGLPPVAATTHSDDGFVSMRIAGPNPVMLRRVDRLDARFPVTEAIFGRVVPGDSLAAAGAEGRLFLCDYAVLDGAEPGNYPPGVTKYLDAPMALFVVDRATRRLRPVAIQCKQVPSETNPVFTPDDGYAWLMAKTVVEVADGNVHEAFTHLGRTHLLMEPFVICTHRQLAPNHPLFRLLAPHFEGTLAINDAAWKHLIAHKGAVDRLCGGSLKSTKSVVVSAVQKCVFNESMLPRSLEERGVADRDWLVDYPYRDDALLYWNAIRSWVASYLGLYYAGDADVQADPEVKEWLREIGSEEGGRIQGLGLDTPPTLGYLIDAVTMVLYTCSVQHAAVNFPQYDLMSYVPNMPLAAYAPSPTSKAGATRADLLAMLPPLDVAELQMELGYLLGTVHYTTLGAYAPGHFADPRVAEPLSIFQTKLSEIGQLIAGRNTSRTPYEFLVPHGIPQSINI